MDLGFRLAYRDAATSFKQRTNGTFAIHHPRFGTVIMIENRRARFGNLPGVGKDEITTAAEIWLEDIVRAPWATREAMKLAAHLVNYMLSANRTYLHIREMETQLQLNREEINRALSLMRLFRVITAFAVKRTRSPRPFIYRSCRCSA